VPMSMVVSAAWPLVVVRAVVIVVVWMVVVVVVVRRGGTVDVPALIAAAVRFGGERPSQRGWRRRGQIAGDPAQIVRTRAAIVRQPTLTRAGSTTPTAQSAHQQRGQNMTYILRATQPLEGDCIDGLSIRRR